MQGYAFQIDLSLALYGRVSRVLQKRSELYSTDVRAATEIMESPGERQRYHRTPDEKPAFIVSHVWRGRRYISTGGYYIQSYVSVCGQRGYFVCYVESDIPATCNPITISYIIMPTEPNAIQRRFKNYDFLYYMMHCHTKKATFTCKLPVTDIHIPEPPPSRK